ncbi:MAG: ABC transporter ATP-binding protein, partial [Alphaproteobacteria bacterium]|nr:ABC transporter ATP-binding protein [Alphaproteobacteria bacterium]
MTDLLIVRDLKVDFHTQAGVVNAVNGISFRVPVGGTVALVGESGSGKSVTAQAIMGILPRTAKISGGEILFHDPKRTEVVVPPERRRPVTDLAELAPDSRQFRAVRGNSISIIFQEPMTSLSPLHTIGDQISEALLLHRDVERPKARDMTIRMLEMVGFPNPQQSVNAYTFELSGGLRQRAMIAMALICRPSLLIADEPSTALDVTIQAQILKLIKDLQAELGMAVLIITHDLGVVANIAEEVVVAYNGSVVESGTLEDIFRRASHPYLQALLRAVPHFDMKDGERLVPIREIEHQAGHLLSAKEPWPETAADAPLLEVRGITKTFRLRREKGLLKVGKSATITAVDDVSLIVPRGKCLGLVG